MNQMCTVSPEFPLDTVICFLPTPTIQGVKAYPTECFTSQGISNFS